MQRTRFAMIAAAAALAVGLTGMAGVAQAADPPQVNIVGGTDVPDGKYPFMASWQFQDKNGKWQHGCGATLIDARGLLLTAKHCIGISEVPNRVVIGRTKLSTEDGYVRGVQHVVEHPDKNADVALLFLDGDVPDVKPIQLVTPGTDALERPGRPVITSGWGSTIKDPWGPGGGGPGTYGPDRMREVTVPIVSTNECRVSYGTRLNPDFEVCAGNNGKDSCQGDSGGPLFVNVPGTEDFIQLGVVSWGFGCGALGFPGVYAKLSNKAVGEWIANFGNDPALTH